MSDCETWQRIEQEVRAQVQSELDTEGAVSLALGALVAWANFGHRARTDGFSSVHRVGEPMPHLGAAMTLCGEIIPPVNRRVALLTPSLIRSLGRCRYCEHHYAEKQREPSNVDRPEGDRPK